VALNSRLADLYVTRGVIYTGTGLYQEAVRDFEQALKLNPVSAAAYRGLAQAYDRLGRSQDAELTFRRAIGLRPNDWAGYQHLGLLYIRRAEYAKAEECVRRVTELAPDSYWGFYTLGAVYHLQGGRSEQAIAMFERSIQLRPTGAAYSNLGTIYSFQGRYQEAARAFEKAVDLGAAYRAIWGNLAEAYLRIPGQAEKAQEACRRAIQLTERDLTVNPKDAEARAHLAVYCARLNQRQRALAEAAKARGLAAGNMTVLFRCALAYELVGRRSLALETLKGALRGGYSRAEVETHPDLAGLRQDPRYTALMRFSSAATPGQTER
jgi:serine/threonine-protein kinase